MGSTATTTQPYYPPVCFYFEVKIVGITASGDSSFAEADGLEAELGTMEIREGGENRFTHRLPDRAAQGKLTLKRGVVIAGSDLAKWCKETIESDFSSPLTTRDINVSLLNENGNPLLVWTFSNAWPLKWSVAGLDSKKNEIALETLEFSYSYCTRAPGPGG
jgi:phage tail-like protein